MKSVFIILVYLLCFCQTSICQVDTLKMPKRIFINDVQPETIVLAETTEAVYGFCEKSPEFIGGLDSLKIFVKNNLCYPSGLKRQEQSGLILVKFIVEKDGSITNVRFLTEVSDFFKTEISKLFLLMPKWNSGTQNGKPVRVFFSLPFKICEGGCLNPNSWFTN